jgi:predicted RNA methylase
MGCFLLIDWLVSIKDQLDGNVALELGAGTGLGSIACGLLTNAAKVFCTGALSILLGRRGAWFRDL